MSDKAITFLDKYNRGEILAALQEVIPAPEFSYDSLISENKDLIQAIVNYADATTQGGGYFISFSANFQLMQVLKKEGAIIAQFPNVLPHLEMEQSLLSHLVLSEREFLEAKKRLSPSFIAFCESFRKGIKLPEESAKNFLSEIPSFLRPFVSHQIAFFDSWRILKTARPDVGGVLKGALPWYPFRYAISSYPEVLSKGETLVLFLEPYNTKFEEFFDSMKDTSKIFVFETEKSLMQMVQFPAVLKMLSDPKHLIYILDKYPNEQLLAQDCRKNEWTSFQPILFSKKKPLIDTLPLFFEALQQCLKQSDEQKKSDSNIGNWLYAISKRILFKIREERYGRSRAAALESATNVEEWFNAHKGLPPSDLLLGPEPHDFFGQRLRELSNFRNQRKFKQREKIRLAHIVPQVVDGGHAPSRLLANLLSHYNRERYEITLISTEVHLWHPKEYPYKSCFSPPSEERGRDLLNEFGKNGISIYLIHGASTFEESAKLTAEVLKNHEVDIAVFHSPQEIHEICAQITDVPFRVVFDHGTHSKYPGFDSEIVSSYESLEIYRNLHQSLKMKAYALPFAVDLRSKWTFHPPKRKDLGLPEEGFIMTTISNNLDARLGREMFLAIVEILQTCQNAYYVAIGEVNNKKDFLKNFREHGIADRIIFLGSRDNPSNIARVMDLYLNEFPVGSGLSILDAMAAGCPIVSMYDVRGPQQGRYGGIYFGIDHTITSCERKDYVALACRLIQNKEFYKEWSTHALKQYEKFSNVKSYVASFEQILEQIIKNER